MFSSSQIRCTVIMKRCGPEQLPCDVRADQRGSEEEGQSCSGTAQGNRAKCEYALGQPLHHETPPQDLLHNWNTA